MSIRSCFKIQKLLGLLLLTMISSQAICTFAAQSNCPVDYYKSSSAPNECIKTCDGYYHSISSFTSSTCYSSMPSGYAAICGSREIVEITAQTVLNSEKDSCAMPRVPETGYFTAVGDHKIWSDKSCPRGKFPSGSQGKFVCSNFGGNNCKFLDAQGMCMSTCDDYSVKKSINGVNVLQCTDCAGSGEFKVVDKFISKNPHASTCSNVCRGLRLDGNFCLAMPLCASHIGCTALATSNGYKLSGTKFIKNCAGGYTIQEKFKQVCTNVCEGFIDGNSCLSVYTGPGYVEVVDGKKVVTSTAPKYFHIEFGVKYTVKESEIGSDYKYFDASYKSGPMEVFSSCSRLTSASKYQKLRACGQ